MTISSIQSLASGKSSLAVRLMRQKTLRRLRENIQGREFALGEEICLSIMSGDETTGDPVQDFAIISCLGIGDEEVFESYRQLQKNWDAHVGRYVIVVQKAEHLNGQDLYVLRNVVLAVCGGGHIELDHHTGRMEFPVQLGYIMYREMMVCGRDPVIRWIFFDGLCMYTGPLENEYCQHGKALKGIDKRIAHVPVTAPCSIEFGPHWDKDHLEEVYGIEPELLRFLQVNLVRKRSNMG